MLNIPQVFGYLVSKATTLPTKLGGIKQRWLLNKIKLTREPKTVFHCQVYLRSLPNQLMEQQSSFL